LLVGGIKRKEVYYW